MTAPHAVARFMGLLKAAWHDASFQSLLLTNPKGGEPGLERLMVREVVLRGERQWSLVWRYATRDITKNLSPEAGMKQVETLLGHGFQNAHLHTPTQEIQLAFSRKGRASLRVGTPADSPAAWVAATKAHQAPQGTAHNKTKQRHVCLDAPYWVDLGLTHPVKGEPELVPAMARKWKQINKFLEVVSAAFVTTTLPSQHQIKAADFGSGKGYLTFAVHDWLRAQGKQAQVTGIEIRADMVKLCNNASARHGCEGLRFEQGDLQGHAAKDRVLDPSAPIHPGALDMMIALHACDTATDLALYMGLRAGASIIMAAPCCHKQLRPQMHMPKALRPMLQHGIHLGQQAEMVTDSLRALLLESQGYDTQVFEFVALEHTSKNKMILAVKRQGQSLAAANERRAQRLEQVAEIKRFYGLKQQSLEQLLAPSPRA
jgi:hypothetical protein